MQRFLFPALIASALAGCAGTGTVGYSASATYATPDLAYVAPGVQVIADYNEPIFYTDGLYWRYYNNNWYRSNYYTGGWAYARPPRALLRIDRPYAYVRYRPRSRTVYRDQRYRDTRPVYRDTRPVYRDQRDHRYYQPSRPVVQPRAPVYRDSRDRRDDRRRDPRDRRRDDRDRDDRDDRDRRDRRDRR